MRNTPKRNEWKKKEKERVTTTKRETTLPSPLRRVAVGYISRLRDVRTQVRPDRPSGATTATTHGPRRRGERAGGWAPYTVWISSQRWLVAARDACQSRLRSPVTSRRGIRDGHASFSDSDARWPASDERTEVVAEFNVGCGPFWRWETTPCAAFILNSRNKRNKGRGKGRKGKKKSFRMTEC